MGTKIQIIYDCVKFTPNDNLNLTCDNKTRCVIYRGETCLSYTEKDKERGKNGK